MSRLAIKKTNHHKRRNGGRTTGPDKRLSGAEENQARIERMSNTTVNSVLHEFAIRKRARINRPVPPERNRSCNAKIRAGDDENPADPKSRATLSMSLCNRPECQHGEHQNALDEHPPSAAGDERTAHFLDGLNGIIHEVRECLLVQALANQLANLEHGLVFNRIKDLRAALLRARKPASKSTRSCLETFACESSIASTSVFTVFAPSFSSCKMPSRVASESARNVSAIVSRAGRGRRGMWNIAIRRCKNARPAAGVKAFYVRISLTTRAGCAFTSDSSVVLPWTPPPR